MIFNQPEIKKASGKKEIDQLLKGRKYSPTGIFS